MTPAAVTRDAPAKAAKKAAPAPAKNGSAPAKKATSPAKKAPAPAAKRRRPAPETPGAALKRQLTDKRDTVGITVLIRQAARVADRLEQIDRVLSGDGEAWIKVAGLPRSDEKRGRIVIEARVDDLVKEERSQTTVLRSLLAEIHRQRSGLPGGVPPGEEDDDLAVE